MVKTQDFGVKNSCFEQFFTENVRNERKARKRVANFPK